MLSGLVVKLMDLMLPTTRGYISEEKQAEARRLLQPGDVLLETNEEYPGWEVVQKATVGSDWTHAALYMGDGKVAHAVSGELFTAEYPLERFLDTYHLAVVRPHYKTEADRQSVFEYMRRAQGRQYDDGFDTGDEGALYCSEAPYHAFRRMPDHPIVLPRTRFLGFSAVPPDAVLHHPEFTLVWSSGSSFWRNMLGQAPMAVGALLGLGAGVLAGQLGVLGAQLGAAPASAVVGGVGGIAGLVAGWGAMKILWPSLDAVKERMWEGKEGGNAPAGQAKPERNFMPRPITISPGGKKTIC